MTSLSWISEKPLLSKLIIPKRQANGRSFGKIVTRHRGGNLNKTQHLVDFNRII
jgi:ribosomal protein L2